MAAGKHRALNPHRNKVGTVVAAGAVPLVPAIVGSGTANGAVRGRSGGTVRRRAEFTSAAGGGVMGLVGALIAFNAPSPVVGD